MNLTAPGPRINGKPDLSGVWQTERTSVDEGAAAFQKHRASGLEMQSAYCLPAALPANLEITEFKTIQAPGQLVVIPGTGEPPRQRSTRTAGTSLPILIRTGLDTRKNRSK